MQQPAEAESTGVTPSGVRANKVAIPSTNRPLRGYGLEWNSASRGMTHSFWLRPRAALRSSAVSPRNLREGTQRSTEDCPELTSYAPPGGDQLSSAAQFLNVVRSRKTHRAG
jgi:hypothetical protein